MSHSLIKGHLGVENRHFGNITKREFGRSLVSIISVFFDWDLEIYSLIISLAPLLDNSIGRVVSHSLI